MKALSVLLLGVYVLMVGSVLVTAVLVSGQVKLKTAVARHAPTLVVTAPESQPHAIRAFNEANERAVDNAMWVQTTEPGPLDKAVYREMVVDATLTALQWPGGTDERPHDPLCVGSMVIRRYATPEAREVHRLEQRTSSAGTLVTYLAERRGHKKVALVFTPPEYGTAAVDGPSLRFVHTLMDLGVHAVTVLPRHPGDVDLGWAMDAALGVNKKGTRDVVVVASVHDRAVARRIAALDWVNARGVVLVSW